jgi:uncharacterized membrane-anchored protein
MFSNVLNLLSIIKYGSIAILAFSLYFNFSLSQENSKLNDKLTVLAQKLNKKDNDLSECITQSLSRYYNDAVKFDELIDTGVEDENTTIVEF